MHETRARSAAASRPGSATLLDPRGQLIIWCVE